MKTFHSLPNPEEMGFKWPAFSKALERLINVESRRREAERTAQELQERIQSEKGQDIKRLADAIASGNPDPAPPGLEDLTEELREQQRLAKYVEALSQWVRTTPPVFSPPSDATVPATFGQLREDADRAERHMQERQEQERLEAEDNRRREREQREASQDGAA